MALPYAAEARDADRFREWVAAGRAGTMGYLKRTSEDGRLLRERAAVPFPLGAFGAGLLCQLRFSLSTSLDQRSRAAERLDCALCVESRVARRRREGERRPSDYHKVLLKRMRAG